MVLRNEKKKLDNPSVKSIVGQLEKLNKGNRVFLILESDRGYIQCVGQAGRLIVEHRIVSGSTFKHYVIGDDILKGDSRGQIEWISLETGVGYVTVRKEEVLQLGQAEELFIYYMEKRDTPVGFNRRNVTRLHKT